MLLIKRSLSTAAVVIAMTACGGSNGDGSADTTDAARTTPPAATALSTTTAPPTTVAPESAPTTMATTTTASTTRSTTTSSIQAPTTTTTETDPDASSPSSTPDDAAAPLYASLQAHAEAFNLWVGVNNPDATVRFDPDTATIGTVPGLDVQGFVATDVDSSGILLGTLDEAGAITTFGTLFDPDGERAANLALATMAMADRSIIADPDGFIAEYRDLALEDIASPGASIDIVVSDGATELRAEVIEGAEPPDNLIMLAVSRTTADGDPIDTLRAVLNLAL